MGSLSAGRGQKRLSDFIREYKDRILAEWSSAARSLPAAAPLSQPGLIDHLPDLLDRIAAVIETDHPGKQAGLDGLPEVHALERLDEGYDLDAMLAEFSLLRSCVLDLSEEVLAGEVRTKEVERFGRAIDEAMRAMVNRYQKAHERTLVALDRVSAVALEAGDAERFMALLLRVLLETTAAIDTATILLREGDRLYPRASVGLLDEREQGFSLAIGEGFSGTIAKTGHPLFLRSAATDPLVVSPYIRARGIRALYGVPLAHEGEVIGVVHVGSTTAWEFSTEDKLLFRVMANRVSALLAQARVREREQRARAEAQAALGQVDAFFEGSPLAAAFLDRDLRYVRVNQALAQANGQPVEAHLGRRFDEVLPKAYADRVGPHLRRVLETGEAVVGLELEAVAPSDPAQHPTLLANYFPVRGGSGEIVGVGATLLDITARKAAARTLEEQQRLYESLLNAQSELGEGFAFVEGGRITLVNQALCRMTGFSREELTRLSSLAELAPPGERARYLARMDALGENQPMHDELTLLRKDGEPIVVEISALGMGPGRRLKVTRDITFKKRAEQERERLLTQLDEARRQLEAILESMPLGVVVRDAGQDGLRLANRRSAELLGQPPTAEISRLRGFHPDGRPYREEEWPIVRSLRSGEVVLGEELDLLRPDGSQVTLAVSSAPIHDAQGQISAGVTAFEDVTEKKRTRQELAEAIDFRDQMVSILGHDLRNPISAIRVATQLLYKRGNLGEPAYRAVARIDHAAERMRELITTLLDFSQSRFRGGLPISPVETNLGQLVTDLAHDAEAASPGARIEVQAEGDTHGVWDPARLSQLVSNLLGNALRYGDRTRPISVVIDGRGERVVLRVHNWGPPIPAEVQPNLFQAFLRAAGPADAHRKQGLGLGLFIASEVVRAHGGTIEVRSAASDGTTFTVVLPRRAPLPGPAPAGSGSP